MNAIPTNTALAVSLHPSVASNGDSLALVVTASASYDEAQGNIIDVYSESSGYLTRLPLVVHAQ